MFDPTQCESVSMAQAKAQEEQNPVNAALRATSIAFVALAESGQIDDTTATENVSQFASWAYPVAYAVGNIRQYNGELFRCVQAHTSQADWTPDATALPDKRAAVAWLVTAEVDAWQALGPQGREVAAIIDRARMLTTDELRQLGAARNAAWNAARDAALATLVRDLITPKQYDLLMAPWRTVIGDQA